MRIEHGSLRLDATGWSTAEQARAAWLVGRPGGGGGKLTERARGHRLSAQGSPSISTEFIPKSHGEVQEFRPSKLSRDYVSSWGRSDSESEERRPQTNRLSHSKGSSSHPHNTGHELNAHWLLHASDRGTDALKLSTGPINLEHHNIVRVLVCN